MALFLRFPLGCGILLSKTGKLFCRAKVGFAGALNKRTGGEKKKESSQHRFRRRENMNDATNSK
jgi:hypothetical protein